MHLVYVVVCGDGVETSVEVVEQVHHLERRAGGRQRGEAHNVAEVDGHRFERLGYHRLALDQIVGHGPAGSKQPLDRLEQRRQLSKSRFLIAHQTVAPCHSQLN